jgi:S1-C subfamily serine protease
MFKRLLYPFLIVFIVSAACSFTSPAAKPTATSAPVPTKELPPTVAAPTKEPTAVATQTQESGSKSKEGVVTNLLDAEKAVVRIVTQGAYEYPDFPASLEESFTGSGFVIDPSGLVITNNHVVTGAALVNVYFSGDPKPLRAKIMGASQCSDLAVIKIEGDNLPYFEWYDKTIDRGLEVYSLGYPLGDPEFTQHKGSVSKKSASIITNWADVDNVIEHDALINPGNSGGPLVTADGKVVGVNYSSLKSAQQYYAITNKEAKPILDDLIAGKDVLSIGVNGEAFQLDSGLSGIWVYSVASGSVADKTGIKSGDVILEMEGIQLAKDGTMKEYCDILRGKKDKAVIGLKVVRYKTGELLEGQLNGRELAVTGKYQTSESSGQSSSSQSSGGQETQQTGDYFNENFSGDTSAWKIFVTAGDPNKKYALLDNNRLKLQVPNSESYVYVHNESYTYSDVYIEAEVETIRGGDNGVAVTCRMSDKGWYELRVHTNGSSAGSFELYRYDYLQKSQGRVPYVNLLKGQEKLFTPAIKAGFQTNKIGFFCEGKNLRIFFNDEEQIPAKGDYFTDNGLSEGTVGIGAMSFNKGPVEVDFVSVTTKEKP